MNTCNFYERSSFSTSKQLQNRFEDIIRRIKEWTSNRVKVDNASECDNARGVEARKETTTIETKNL